MKKMIFTVAFILTPIFSLATELVIENSSGKHVALGEYKGWKVPSICESTGYGFCWEEVGVRFRPYSGFSNVQGTKSLTLKSGSDTRLIIDEKEHEQIQILNSCGGFIDLSFVQKISGTIVLEDISSVSVCAATDKVTIQIK